MLFFHWVVQLKDLCMLLCEVKPGQALPKIMKRMCETYSHVGPELRWTQHVADGSQECYLRIRDFELTKVCKYSPR